MLFNLASFSPRQPLEQHSPALAGEKEKRTAYREERLRTRLREIVQRYRWTGTFLPPTWLASELGIGLKTLRELSPEVVQEMDVQYREHNFKAPLVDRLRRTIDELILAGELPTFERIGAKGFYIDGPTGQFVREERERRGIPFGLHRRSAQMTQALEAERVRILKLRNSQAAS
ncbi:hypothetical protein [Burkholderia sp. PU8-34]